MKRNAAFLIQKRDGRREWLRATKLARSIHLALVSAGECDGTDALELASAVLRDVAARHATSLRAETRMVTSGELAQGVSRALFASGRSRAAACFVEAARSKSTMKFALQSRSGVDRDERSGDSRESLHSFTGMPAPHERN
ncbi:MAG: hypothetical protein U1F36_08025 [Planctomycetota bacterium]